MRLKTEDMFTGKCHFRRSCDSRISSESESTVSLVRIPHFGPDIVNLLQINTDGSILNPIAISIREQSFQNIQVLNRRELVRKSIVRLFLDYFRRCCFKPTSDKADYYINNHCSKCLKRARFAVILVSFRRVRKLKQIMWLQYYAAGCSFLYNQGIC